MNLNQRIKFPFNLIKENYFAEIQPDTNLKIPFEVKVKPEPNPTKKFNPSATQSIHDEIISVHMQPDLNMKTLFDVNSKPHLHPTRNIDRFINRSGYYKITSVGLQPEPNPKFHFKPIEIQIEPDKTLIEV